VRVNGITDLAVTKLDVLDELDEIKVCIAYEYEGRTLKEFPTDLKILRNVKPVYHTLPGWKQTTSDVRKWDDLPPAAQNYLRFIEKITGASIKLVSVGSRRDQTIFL